MVNLWSFMTGLQENETNATALVIHNINDKLKKENIMLRFFYLCFSHPTQEEKTPTQH